MSLNHANQIIQHAIVGSLGTLTSQRTPMVTLVNVAAVGPNSIALLLSGLAKHTNNLDACPACSLLLVDPNHDGDDLLAGARLTLDGSAKRLSRDDDAEVRATFLSKHASAQMYADFPDFAFYVMHFRQGHFVAGFGRIETVSFED